MSENCKDNLPCHDCDDPALTTSAPCGEGVDCEGDDCPETFSAGCVVWTGPSLICNTTVVAQEGMRLDAILETMLAVLCGSQSSGEGFALILPTPNGAITGPDDIEICVDRNNCFEDLVVSVPDTAPEGITFSWVDAGGTPHLNDTTMLIEAGRSCLLFSWDTGSLPQGQNSFNFEITGCGTTVTVPVFITIP